MKIFRELSKYISLLTCIIVFNYFQNRLIYCQNKKGISSIGTQCINRYLLKLSRLLLQHEHPLGLPLAASGGRLAVFHPFQHAQLLVHSNSLDGDRRLSGELLFEQ